MTDREKLIKLIHHCTSCEECHDSDIADHLIANGVTVQEDCEACAEKAQKCIEGLQEKLAEMPKKQEWISVEEKLPNMNAAVLMHFEHNMVVGYLYDIDEGCTCWRANIDDGWESNCDFEPTHWMPLPEPPKEGQKCAK